MITVKQEPLPEQQALALIQWLSKGTVSTLIAVVEAKQKTLEVKALERAVTATSSENPLMLAAADDDLKKACRYATFLKVLEELRSQKEFTTVKLA